MGVVTNEINIKKLQLGVEALPVIMSSVQSMKLQIGNVSDTKNAGNHNSIYRGKNLGSEVTAAQWAAISDGTFDDLFIGDYWEMNSIKYRIAHFDYWLNSGSDNTTAHHVVIVPDAALYTAKMEETDISTNGYAGSKMRGGDDYLVENSSNLYDAKVAIEAAFGSSHILSHKVQLSTASSSGKASAVAWKDSTIDLMNEVMVYGSLIVSTDGKGKEVGVDKSQFALFALDPSMISTRTFWWLRGIASAAAFCGVTYNGGVGDDTASHAYGVRPFFAIK